MKPDKEPSPGVPSQELVAPLTKCATCHQMKNIPTGTVCAQCLTPRKTKGFGAYWMSNE